jgi:IPT/TIG domain
VAGGAVNLVVAGSSGGTAPPPPANPVVTLLVPTSVRAGGSLEIRGSGFAGTSSTVTMGGINAVVLGTSNATRLFVTVPSGIPGAPTLPGGAPATDIVVRVANPGGQASTMAVTVLPPLTNPLTISSITPNPVSVGQAVTIAGTGFSATPGQQSVSFGGVPATPSAATSTQLTVTVPTGIPGLVAPGDSTTVNVTVTRSTDNVTSGALPLSVDL